MINIALIISGLPPLIVKVATKIEAYTEKGGLIRRKNTESWASYTDIDRHKIVKNHWV